MTDEQNKLLLDTLREDLQREQATNQRSTIIGGSMVVLLAGYLTFLHGQVSSFFDPEELALFATGAAMEAAPSVEAQLRHMLVTSAPDIARSVSTKVVDSVPTYRQVLEAELKPVLDESTRVMAGAAVGTMLKSDRPENLAEREGMEAAAEAVVERLDRVFEEALYERAELDGPTPAELIDQTADRLVVVDRGLRRLARGGDEAAERDLVLTVLGVIDGVQETQETVEKTDFAAKERAISGREAKAAKKKGEKAPETPAPKKLSKP